MADEFVVGGDSTKIVRAAGDLHGAGLSHQVDSTGAEVFGTTADNPVNFTSGTPWYSPVSSFLSYIKLLVAAQIGAGSRTYTYTNGVLTTETWTLFGTTRTKTYSYTGSTLTGESDWT